MGRTCLPRDCGVGVIQPNPSGRRNTIGGTLLKTGLLNALLPEILKVPLVIERKPAVLALKTEKEPFGKNSRTLVLLVPLLTVTPVVWRKLVEDAAPFVQLLVDPPEKMI